MKNKNTDKNILTALKIYLVHLIGGLLIGLMLMTPVTQAQWTVFDPTLVGIQSSAAGVQSSIFTNAVATKIEQGLEYVREAERWISTVEHYSTTVINQVKQFTSMKGILSFAEKNLGITQDTIKAVGNIGQIVNGMFTLKNQFMSLIHTRLDMLERLDSRARNGIFNPQADLDDLNAYVKKCMNKSTSADELSLAKIAETDDRMEKQLTLFKQLRAQRVVIWQELNQVNEDIKKQSSLSTSARNCQVDDNGDSMGCDDTNATAEGQVTSSSDAIQLLTVRKGQLEAEDADLKKQEDKVTEEINKINEEYHDKFDQAYFTAHNWQQYSKGWGVFADAQAHQMEVLLDTTGKIVPNTTATP